jgi:hypothetical protein
MNRKDALVLLVLSAFVIVTAGAQHARTLMCSTNLRSIGQAMASYTADYDGKLPLLQYYNASVPAIESVYLLSRNVSGKPVYIQLGCLYGAGHLGSGEILFCPAISGSIGSRSSLGTNNGTYMGAVHSVTLKFADITPGVSQPNQGYKATRGYCYWPLSQRLIVSPTDLTKMPASTWNRYKVGMPYSATTVSDLNPTKPMVADCKFHYTDRSEWKVNCLHPDGHVSYQDQPKRDGLNGYGQQGTWGMYSNNENCQLPSSMTTMTDPVTVSDPVEKARQLATAVTPTEFACALQP